LTGAKSQLPLRLFLVYLRKMANAVPLFGKGLGAHMSNPNGQKLKDKNGKAFDLPHGRLLKIGELKMTRWNPFEGKPKPLEWRRPPAKQQAFSRTPAGATTGNHEGRLSGDSETEEEEWEAPNEEELEALKMSKQAPAHPTGPKGRPFKGKAKDGKKRVKAQDPEWLANNLKPSPFDKIAHHRGAPWEVRWMLAQAQANGMQRDGKVHDVGRAVHGEGKVG
jgi:hypothetical protein